MDEFWTAVIGGLVGGSLTAALVTALTTRQVTKAKSEVEDTFKRIVEVRDSRRALLEEVLGPVCAHLNRTGIAFSRWNKRNLALEAGIILESNRQIRDTLLSKYHLLTPELRRSANSLIEHYDMWLEEYERVRGANPSSDQEFVFVGPGGYPFPHEAEKAFLDALEETYRDLTATGTSPRQHARPSVPREKPRANGG